MSNRLRLDKLRQLSSIDLDTYEARLTDLQHELERVQHAYLFSGDRAAIAFEGMDAAGKGGAIRRISWALDPRSLKVWPIGAPNPIEMRQHYLQRFWARMPERGHTAIFDRSWYGRVLVERVEGFAKPAEWKRAYREINEFERQLIENGTRVIKVFLHISKSEQLRRFEERLRNPRKRWKLSYEDFRNRDRWDDYVEAIEDMFDRTSTKHARWHAVQGDNKPAARLEVLRVIIDEMSRGLAVEEPKVDPKVLKLARQTFGGVRVVERRKRPRVQT
ncbi:MAG TPA: hypothetical protein VMT54_04575 [Candidatus Cybelea sp.]|nr:hypothetical protein [Candidatus Cybelea sp.]